MPCGTLRFYVLPGREIKPLNRDFRDLLAEFNVQGVEYLIVGAHALAAHGHVRATKDLDVWVRPDAENATRVYLAAVAPLQYRRRSAWPHLPRRDNV